MKTIRISLNSIDKVKSFVNDLAKFDADFDLVSGRYVIDAKSIMGVITLGATYKTKLLCTCSGEDEQEAMKAMEDLFLSRFEEK